MQRYEKNKVVLGVLITVLSILVLISFVLVSSSILKIGEGVPSTSIELNGFNSVADSDIKTTDVSSSASNTSNNAANDYDVYVEDDVQIWTKETTIELFKMSYVNENGEVNVQSAYKDMVVAPGTSNKYVFYVRNPGDIPKEYNIKAVTEVVAVVNEDNVKIPLQARLYDHDGKYYAGSENEFIDIYDFGTVTAQCDLSGDHYSKYTFEWQWPFEGDDELDTFLGNMSAQGDAISVKINLIVEAVDKPGAVGGVPETGDMSQIGLWTGICVTASFMIILLLFLRKRDDEDKQESN